MKAKLILAGIVITISLSLFACSPSSKQVSVKVSCDDFYKHQHISKQVEVAAGDSFTFTLCSNPTTGFKWESARISDQAILQEVDHKFVSPESEPPPPPGTAGQEVWTFRGLKEGKSTISIYYSRPWESGEKGEWTFTLDVVVK